MTTVTSYNRVDRWNVSGKQILLFRQKDETSEKLNYKIEDGQSNPVEIPSRLYSNINRTCNNVLLFHDVIEANLNHIIEPSSFIPVLASTAQIKQQERYVPVRHLKVALFGRGDSSTKTIHVAHWGIYDQRDNSTKRVVIQKIEGDLQECLVNVLFNRYYISFYEDRVRIEVSLDSDSQVQSLALTILSRPSSIFDKKVYLDENHWAVTLISTKQHFSARRISAGHAMIACEGVNEGHQFLKYVHITKKPEEGDTNKSSSGARVEIVKEVFFIEHKSPTWRRPRSAVENLLLPIQKAHQSRQRVPFALGGTICKAMLAFSGFNSSLVLFLHRFIPKIVVFNRHSLYYHSLYHAFALGSITFTTMVVSCFAFSIFMGSNAYTSYKPLGRYDCLIWSIEQLPKAGIHFQLPFSIITPNAAVEYLNKHSKDIVLKDS